MMVIYKFGGASVKNESAFKLLKSIVAKNDSQLIVVVSAMGKTTNGLEEIVKLAARGHFHYKELLTALKSYHLTIAKNLTAEASGKLLKDLNEVFLEVEETIDLYKDRDFNFFYDQVVSWGEILSTKIVSAYLHQEGVLNRWVDIRELLKTNDNYRDATLDFRRTQRNFSSAFTFDPYLCYITQGFIGSDPEGNTTTLGREGSDYTAALLANMLNAKSLTLWKDVAGIFNADPAIFNEVILLEKVRYQEMIELAYYGAKVIHPKTIKPLRIKQIPLYVKCFSEGKKIGTQVGNFPDLKRNTPIVILKENQVLISISLPDLSFIGEDHLSKLFDLLNRFRLKANLMQHSAVSFSVSVDEPRGREVIDLIEILRKDFKVLYNEKLTLITIRHYTESAISDQISGKKVFVEQRSRNTVQYLTA